MNFDPAISFYPTCPYIVNGIQYTKGHVSPIFGTWFSGALGNTMCCGASAVLVPYYTVDIIINILRNLPSSVIHLNAVYPTWGEYKNALLLGVNGALVEHGAKIELIPEEKGYILILHIDNPEAYGEWRKL